MASAIPIAVHPQAILQIADQAARYQYLVPPGEYSCGVILGTADGPRVEISSALETRMITRNSKLVVDKETYHTMLRQHHAIYPNEKPIGWYSCKPLDKSQLTALRDAFEALDNSTEFIRGEFLADREQPLFLYAPKGDTWITLEYSYESELAERIAMMQLQSEGDAKSQLQFTADAFRALDAHLAIIENYLQSVAAGKAPFNAELVRRCADVGQWWKHSSRDASDERIIEQERVALFVGVLAETISLLEARDRA